MKKIFLLSGLFMLSACAGIEPPKYVYDNSHKIDKKLNDDNVCFVVDIQNSTIKKGHQNLSISPFLGQEAYSPNNVKKKQYVYDAEYDNPYCKNPITIKRQIELSSISYPGTCYGSQYAGSVYTGATSNISPYGTVSTRINSIPQYNTVAYSCMRTQYYISIDFYNGNSLVGNIKNDGWSNYSDIDDTIRYYTDSFFNEIQNDYSKKNQKAYCSNCFKECESIWCNFGCSLKGCNIDENR